jgi:hypothetical protein
MNDSLYLGEFGGFHTGWVYICHCIARRIPHFQSFGISERFILGHNCVLGHDTMKEKAALEWRLYIHTEPLICRSSSK